MSYILGGTTLPQPKRFFRMFIEKAVEHLLMFGKTTKKIENRKERFILQFQHLTEAQINSILSLYNLEQVISFQVTETNLTIATTDVLVDIRNRSYPMTGEIHKEHLVLVLTEVK